MNRTITHKGIYAACLSILAHLSPLCLAQNEIPWNTCFHTEGRDIVADAAGDKCVFRGVSLAGLEYGQFSSNAYPGVLSVDYFQPQSNDLHQVRSWGFNVVRIPFEWGRLVPSYLPGNPVSLQPSYLATIAQILRWAEDEHLYVILDMHDYLKYWPGYNALECVDSSPPHQIFLAETWRQLAAFFATNRTLLGYEIMNEPVRAEAGSGSCSDSNWHAIAQQTINSIRLVDTKHIIFIDGRDYSLPGVWQRENGTNAFVHDPLTPPRLVYSPHVYYDLKGESHYSEGNVPVSPWQYYIRDRLLPLLDWSEANQVPIFITEHGIPNSVGWASVLSEVFSTYYNPLRLSCVYWLHDPRHSTSMLRLQSPGFQLPVLTTNLGGTYAARGQLVLTDKRSPLYDGGLIAPWIDASWVNGTATYDSCGGVDTNTGKCTIYVTFGSGYSGLKFYHDFLDTKRYDFLQFTICGVSQQGQDLWIYTSDRHGIESSYSNLSNYAVLTGQVATVRIPLAHLVNPQDSVITSVVFKNKGTAQPTFRIGDIFLAAKMPPVFSSVSVSNGLLRLSLTNLTPGFHTSIERSLDLGSATWTGVFGFDATGGSTNWAEPIGGGRAFYRTR